MRFASHFSTAWIAQRRRLAAHDPLNNSEALKPFGQRLCECLLQARIQKPMAWVNDVEDIRAVVLDHVLNQLVSNSMVVEKRIPR